MSYHRTQKVGGKDPQWMLHCTIYAFLTAIAIATRGKYGTSTYGPAFRAAQRDQSGGIDLWDAKLAASRLFPTVNVKVHANYGSTPTKRINVQVMLGMIAAKVPYVVQGGYAAVPRYLSGQHTFRGPHAIAAVDYNAASRQVLVSDPLRGSYVWWPLRVFQAFIAELSGSTGYALAAAVTPTFQSRVRVLPGLYYRYQKVGSKWTSKRYATLGFAVNAGPRTKVDYFGHDRTLVRILNGKWAGQYLNVNAPRHRMYMEVR